MPTQLRERDVIQARVTAVKDNGLYLEAAGKPGFINVTELSYRDGPVDVRAFAAVGDELNVLVYAVTPSGFYGSLKQLEPANDPWGDRNLYRVGDRFEGTVETVAPFGAFVRTPTGLLARLEGPCSVGDRVTAEVTAVDRARRKVECSRLDGLPVDQRPPDPGS